MKWLWPGPYEDGITQSMVGNFLTDPYSFFLYYGLGLEEPETPHPNLIWGNMYHKGLEMILLEPQSIASLPASYWTEVVEKEVLAEWKKYSGVPMTFVYSVVKMLALYKDDYLRKPYLSPPKTELKFKVPYKTDKHSVQLKGKIDGWQDEMRILIEHKTKKQFDRTVIKSELPHDLQLNFYITALGTTPEMIVYDLIKIPEAQWNFPAPHKNENSKYHIIRLFETHRGEGYPICRNAFMWQDQITTHIPSEMTIRWQLETLNPIINRICELYNYTSTKSFDFFNPTHCNELFYKQPLRHFNPSLADSFKRRYHNFLTGQIRLEDLKPVQSLFSELEDL